MPNLSHGALLTLLALAASGLSPVWPAQPPECNGPGCHEGVLRGGGRMHEFLHGPVAQGRCTDCHVPAGGFDARRHGRESFRPRPEGGALCFGCHPAQKEELALGSAHRPFAEERCGACHGAHGSDYRKLLVASEPALCGSCHPDAVRTALGSTHLHKALYSSSPTQPTTSTPQVFCTQCHAPHGSGEPRLLRKGPGELCVGCHWNFEAEILSRQERHRPTAQGDCGACHSLHGANQAKLLARPYRFDPGRTTSAAKHAPFRATDAELCWACHNAEIALAPRTKALTRFRNGDLNLHRVHVNGPAGGYSCKVCHWTHAGRGPFRTVFCRDILCEWPSGVWFTSEGGRCVGPCHRLRQYDRGDPVTR